MILVEVCLCRHIERNIYIAYGKVQRGGTNAVLSIAKGTAEESRMNHGFLIQREEESVGSSICWFVAVPRNFLFFCVFKKLGPVKKDKNVQTPLFVSCSCSL